MPLSHGTSATPASTAGTYPICSGPALGVTRAVHGILVFNDDIIAHDFSIHYLNPSAEVVKVVSTTTLGPKESLRIEAPPALPMHNSGFLNFVLDANVDTNDINITVIFTDIA
jgi:hypothetical protein